MPGSAEPRPSPSAELRGVLLGGRYRLGHALGSGAMGVVFAATDERLNRDVAVKVVRAAHMRDPETIERFEREARHAGKLGHANIVSVTDMGRTDEGFPFVVMERLEGRTLEQRVEADGVLPVEEAVEVHVQLLDALACAHDAGVLHRDVKPANVFLATLATGAPLVKLLDFGIAQTSTDKKLTMDGSVVGSPVYLAPERFRGQPARIESDLYSVGVSLFEALLGRVPFDGKMGAALQDRVLHEVAPRVDSLRRDVPAALADLVARTLNKEPETRHATARQLREALRAIDVKKAAPDERKRVGTLLGVADPAAPIALPHAGVAMPASKITLPQASIGAPAEPIPAPARPPVAIQAVASAQLVARPPVASPPKVRELDAATDRVYPGPVVPPSAAVAPPRTNVMWIVAAVLVVGLFAGLGAFAAMLQGGPADSTAAGPAVAAPVATAPGVTAPASTAPPAAAPVSVPVTAPPGTASTAGAAAPVPVVPVVPSGSGADLPIGVEPPETPVVPAPRTGHSGAARSGHGRDPVAHSARAGSGTSTGEREPLPAEAVPPVTTSPPPPEERPRGRVGADGLIAPNW